jgi:hypothetical protein
MLGVVKVCQHFGRLGLGGFLLGPRTRSQAQEAESEDDSGSICFSNLF